MALGLPIIAAGRLYLSEVHVRPTLEYTTAHGLAWHPLCWRDKGAETCPSQRHSSPPQSSLTDAQSSTAQNVLLAVITLAHKVASVTPFSFTHAPLLLLPLSLSYFSHALSNRKPHHLQIAVCMVNTTGYLGTAQLKQIMQAGTTE